MLIIGIAVFIYYLVLILYVRTSKNPNKVFLFVTLIFLIIVSIGMKYPMLGLEWM